MSKRYLKRGAQHRRTDEAKTELRYSKDHQVRIKLNGAFIENETTLKIKGDVITVELVAEQETIKEQMKQIFTARVYELVVNDFVIEQGFTTPKLLELEHSVENLSFATVIIALKRAL